jgi:hypothetical protein
MRVFIAACIVAGLIAVVGALALNAVPDSVQHAFATSAVRI